MRTVIEQHAAPSLASRAGGLVRPVLAAGALALLAAGALGAQSAPVGPRWQAWLGCWAPQSANAAPSAGAPPVVCVTPTADVNVVEIATLGEGKVVSRERVDASGQARAVEAKGCAGTRRANWSADGRRVYLHATANCDGTSRITSGILAMAPNGDWLDVQGVAAGEGHSLRVARYQDIGLPATLPLEISTVLSGRLMSRQAARVAAAAALRIADVVEASRAADSAVVEAWILERGQRFALTGRDLLALDDAGVPARVTDALVAVSNPQMFALARDEEGVRLGERGPDIIDGRGGPMYPDPYDPYGWGYHTPYGNGRGYGRYGYPGYYPPVIIVNGSGERSQGRMVKGEGYTREPSSTSSAPRAGGTTRSPDPAAAEAPKGKDTPAARPTRTARPRG